MTKDNLGDRMKWYEGQYKTDLMPLIPICARMDGRAFHTFTKGLKKPFDTDFSSLMIATMKYLVETTNALIGYTQSDEISLIWYAEDYDNEIFFGGDHSKMVSILAAKTTNFFNKKMDKYLPDKCNEWPEFDARVWNVPTQYEATNYLIWREMDATRNSITMAAQSQYSHKELHKKSSSEKQEMLFKKGINWNDYPSSFKRGTYMQRVSLSRPYTATEIDKLPEKHKARTDKNLQVVRKEVLERVLPPFTKIANRSEVVFDGAAVILRSEA